MMKVLNSILSLLFASSALAYEAPTELKFETTYSPPDCSPNSPRAARHSNVKVHYTGTLHKTGVKFDSSHDRKEPLPFTLGAGQVIKGWDQGIEGMCLNEKRKLIIPSNLAYGERGFGSIIPANSALVFDVELVSLDLRDEL